MWAQEYNKPNDKVTFMNTLTSCVNKVVKDGYTDSFKVTRQGLYATSNDKTYKPEEIHVINFYRFEGESDPGDMVIMYVIETNDGVKGTLVDAFGTYSDVSVSAFMKEVEDIHKKAVRNDRPEA
ncbi:MAG TPA: hypothetical protein PL009_08145 [Flavipsychrobacter sp.]|nr:hypothetical protein [Flavipsychrobacter sp.]